MAYTTIDDPKIYFNTVLYTGNGSTQSVTGFGHAPNLIWTKERNNAKDHAWYDSVRGANQLLESNKNGADSTTSAGISSFDSDGFTTGDFFQTNDNGDSYVSWGWKAGGSASSNSNGSITSSVSAGITQGMSIVSYTGTGSNATVGHGLGSAPAFVIVKDRGNALSWVVSGDNIGWNKNVYLDSTQAVQTANHFQDTAPTSSLMYLATDVAVNGSSRNYIMYCFAEKKGYSKFGSYTGNGNADGTFVYTGFRPALVICKKSDSDTNDWFLMDNKRNGFNAQNYNLEANTNGAEQTNSDIDILSNGFKTKSNGNGHNTSGHGYIYMAFAESPFVNSNGVPTNAR